MSDKKKQSQPEDLSDAVWTAVGDNVQWVEETKAQPKKEYYTTAIWKGVKPVFQCTLCDTQLSNEDEIKLHVIEHYPEKDKNKILDELTKE